MKILALEFSSSLRSVAVVEGGQNNSPVVLGSSSETGQRETRAFARIQESLDQAALKPEQIDGIAVGLGPGSYTGIRIAISIAQGWQLARGIRLLGISSAECLAYQTQAEGLIGRVHLFIDAHRHEFYTTTYELSSKGAKEIEPLRLCALKEAQALGQTGVPAAGPDLQRWLPTARPVYPQAAILGQLAVQRSNYVAGEILEPIYLRAANFVKAPPLRVIPEI